MNQLRKIVDDVEHAVFCLLDAIEECDTVYRTSDRWSLNYYARIAPYEKEVEERKTRLKNALAQQAKYLMEHGLTGVHLNRAQCPRGVGYVLRTSEYRTFIAVMTEFDDFRAKLAKFSFLYDHWRAWDLVEKSNTYRLKLVNTRRELEVVITRAHEVAENVLLSLFPAFVAERILSFLLQ